MSGVELMKIFSQSVGCCFFLLTMSFALQKLCSFMRSHLLVVNHSVWFTDILFKKLSPVPMSSRLFHTFCSVRFSVSCFMLRSLIHLNLSFMQGDKHGSICILLHENILLDQHHLLTMLSSFLCMVLASLSKIKCPKLCRFISGSLIWFHWSTFLYLYQCHEVFITIAL